VIFFKGAKWYSETRTAIQNSAIRQVAAQRRWARFAPDFRFLATCGTMRGQGIGPHASMIDTTNSLQLALLSAAILGFRHGFDYDHIAAISDITSVQTTRWRGMRLGLLYALGHAAMVAALGSAVIVFQLSLPHGVDRIAERLVGLTLLILGVYVLGSLFKGNPVPRSRFHVMAGALRWIHWKMKSYWHDHDVLRPVEKNWNYSSKSVLMIGVVHGLGAETPSQLMIFLLAANLGGIGKGFLGLAMFIAGLLVMNTIMTASAVGLFGFSSQLPRFQFVVTALTAIYSLAVGAFFLFGSSGLLPPLG
jgi:high-affinity nickel permease